MNYNEYNENRSYTDIEELILKNKIKKQTNKLFYKDNGKIRTKLIILCSISLLLNILKQIKNLIKK